MTAYSLFASCPISTRFWKFCAIMMCACVCTAAGAVEQVFVKLGGKQFGHGVSVEVNSATNLISNSKIYQFKIAGKVRGNKGALRKAFPKAQTLAQFMESVRPGSSAMLVGRYENPTESLPVTLRTQSISGRRSITGFGKVRISMSLTTSIDQNGLVVFRMENIKFTNKNGKLKGRMAFRAGTVMVHTAPAIMFQTSNLSVEENQGAVELIVVREGYRGMAASIQYATSDSSAVAGKDYTSSTGLVSFAANEFEKTISIPVIDNAEKDKPRQFNVILTSPSDGAVVGQNVAAVVRIMNEDR